MDPTPADITEVRQWIGTDDPTTDQQILVLVSQAGSAKLAAQQILRARRANLLNGPASFSVNGYSESNVAIIAAIDADLNSLEAVTGVDSDEGAFTTSQLVRPDRCRR